MKQHGGGRNKMRTRKKSEWFCLDSAINLWMMSELEQVDCAFYKKIPPFYNERYALDSLLGSVQSW